MSHSITIDSDTLEALKRHAEPLVDTYDTVIMRALAALSATTAGSRAEPTTGFELDPTHKAAMTHSRIVSATIGGRALKKSSCNWRALLPQMVGEALKVIDVEEVRKTISTQTVVGVVNRKDFKYHSTSNLSFQGQNAPTTWSDVYRLAERTHIAVEVELSWPPGVVSPHAGKTATMRVKW